MGHYGALFVTIHFIHNLQMGPISQSTCHWKVFSGQCNEHSSLMGLNGALSSTLHFLHNLQMGPISYTVFSAQSNVTFQLIGPIHMLQRKKGCEYSPCCVIHETSYILHKTLLHRGCLHSNHDTLKSAFCCQYNLFLRILVRLS